MNKKLPAVKPSRAIRALGKAGFFVHHQTGSHVILRHKYNSSLRVVVPMHNKDLKKGTLHRIIIDAGLTPERFRELL